MRIAILATLLLGCSGAAPGVSEADDEPRAGRAETTREAAPEPVAPEVRSELCLTTDAATLELIPTIETVAKVVGARWGWDVEFHADEAPSDCSLVTVGDVVDEETGDTKSAMHSRGDWSGAYVGWRSVITINADALRTEGMVETSEAGCVASYPQAFRLVSAALTHELGHMLAVPHSSDPASPMWPGLSECYDPMPTAADLAASLRPGGWNL